MAMVAFITKPTWPYCYKTYAIKCKLWSGVQDGLLAKKKHHPHFAYCPTTFTQLSLTPHTTLIPYLHPL